MVDWKGSRGDYASLTGCTCDKCYPPTEETTMPKLQSDVADAYAASHHLSTTDVTLGTITMSFAEHMELVRKAERLDAILSLVLWGDGAERKTGIS